MDKNLVIGLNERLGNNVFEDWIELDNLMISEGFVSNEKCDYLFAEGSVVYQTDKLDPFGYSVRIFFEDIEGSLFVSAIKEWSLAKQLNEELAGLEFEDWIELDNYMVSEGFASTDNCDWGGFTR